MTAEILRSLSQLPSSLVCDDCYVGGSHATRIPHSLPAQAGIQRLCFLTYRMTQKRASNLGVNQAKLSILNIDLINEALRSFREIVVGGKRAYNKVHGERIHQGNFSQAWRACPTDPDGLQTIVVIKEATHTP